MCHILQQMSDAQRRALGAGSKCERMKLQIGLSFPVQFGGFLKWGYPQSSSILIGFSILNQPVWKLHIYRTPIWVFHRPPGTLESVPPYPLVPFGSLPKTCWNGCEILDKYTHTNTLVLIYRSHHDLAAVSSQGETWMLAAVLTAQVTWNRTLRSNHHEKPWGLPQSGDPQTRRFTGCKMLFKCMI